VVPFTINNKGAAKFSFFLNLVGIPEDERISEAHGVKSIVYCYNLHVIAGDFLKNELYELHKEIYKNKLIT
jgi:hypothetical protein